jgi:FtsH-binding integral membrane protein
MPAKESSMLDLVFLGAGVVLFCLLIAYERLCNRL